jgi:hypothetical protein
VMVAPNWRLPLLGLEAFGPLGRAGRGDRPQGSRRTRESSPDLAVERDPGAQPSRPPSGTRDGEAQEGRGREAGSIAAGRELRRGGNPKRASFAKGGTTPRNGRLFDRSKALESRRSSRPSRPQRRRQGEPETARGQGLGNGRGRSKGSRPCRVNPRGGAGFRAGSVRREEAGERVETLRPEGAG